MQEPHFHFDEYLRSYAMSSVDMLKESLGYATLMSHIRSRYERYAVDTLAATYVCSIKTMSYISTAYLPCCIHMTCDVCTAYQTCHVCATNF